MRVILGDKFLRFFSVKDPFLTFPQVLFTIQVAFHAQNEA